MRISDWSSDVCSSYLLPDGKAWFVLDNNHLLRPQPVPCRPWVVRSNGVAGVVAPIALPVLFPELNYFHVGLIGFHQFVRSSCQLIQMLPLASGFDGFPATSGFTDMKIVGTPLLEKLPCSSPVTSPAGVNPALLMASL